MVLRCYKCFDALFQGPVDAKSASAAMTSSYGIDTNWYFDSGSTDHITGELEKLSVRDKYHGGDQVHTANGSGMEIGQIGHSFVHTPSDDLTYALLCDPEKEFAIKDLGYLHFFLGIEVTGARGELLLT